MHDLSATLRHVEFGERLKEERERRGITQEALASKMKLKRPTPISLMEGPRKKVVPKPTTIKRLAAALGCEPGDLLRGVLTEYDKLRGVTAEPKEGPDYYKQFIEAEKRFNDLNVLYDELKEAVERAYAVSRGQPPKPHPISGKSPRRRSG